MMDLTSRAFRAVVRTFGGCGLYYSEMLNAQRVPRESGNAPIYAGFGREPDLMCQLVGDDPAALAAAVHRLEAFEPAGFDWNLGCARGFIRNQGWGAALLEKPREAARALRALRGATRRPLSVKMRLPAEPGDERLRGFVSMLAREGADAIILHPRQADKIFTRPARWESIAKVKSWVEVPVIGNGDVRTPEDALDMFRRTGCDGVMIGRGAVARPHLFRDIAACLEDREVPAPPPAREILESMLEQLGERVRTPKGARELKTFCQYFADCLPVPHWFWGPLQGLRDGPALAAAARRYFEPRESRDDLPPCLQASRPAGPGDSVQGT